MTNIDIEAFEDSSGRHLCLTCCHIPEELKDCGSTTNLHPCEIGPWPQEFAETEDNGAGFWVISCPHYKRGEINFSQYLTTDEWKAKRAARLKLDDWTCQRCGKAMNLNVHHISYAQIPYEPLEDLITLCKQCHRAVHKLPTEE